MPVKLIQVSKDLRLGISTVVEYLQKHGHAVENNPNVRISNEQFLLLIKEFGKALSQQEKDTLLSKLGTVEQELMPCPVKKESEIKKRKDRKPKVEEIKTEIPEELKLKLITKGKIDLSTAKNLDKPKREGGRPAESKRVGPRKSEKKEPMLPFSQESADKIEPVAPKGEVSVPKVELVVPKMEPSAPNIVVSLAEQVMKDEHVVKKEEVLPVSKEDNDGVFRIDSPRIEPVVKGKIDLDVINPLTRPLRKSKEERRKERRDRQRRERPAVKPPAQQLTAKPTVAPQQPLRQVVTSPVSTPSVVQRPSVIPKENREPHKVIPSFRSTLLLSKTTAAGDSEKAKDKPKEPEKPKDIKKKRGRIKKGEKVDINTTPGTNDRRLPRDDNKRNRLRRIVKVEVSEEEVQKQVKETLARLTNKGNKGAKGAKYRKDKRDAALQREHELMAQEEQDRKVLKLTEFVTANDLANMMDIPVTQVIATCMNIDIMVSINQRLNAETINIVAEEFGFSTEYVSAEVAEAIKTNEQDNEADREMRPPIVTVMGHVDHGKTSLLDNIRDTNVIAGEAGGITQHIGAYNVKLPRTGRRITFLDTPGHEAFTAMRARGAKITDIAIIVVAADDNVMPQTVEAINHASAANVPIVFAINKIDKPHANPEKIKEELANMNYLVEDWGGKYQSQEISAKKGDGVEELLEKVLLEADLLELKANPKLRATGSIIESSLDKGRGYVSTVLVENGTLKPGDVILAGTHYGRVKAMFNERNQKKDYAGPSEPVLILGLSGAPQAGDTFNVLETDQEAREIAARREQLQRELGLRTQKRLTLPEIGKRLRLGSFQELNVIVKGDVDGSVEALSDSLIRLSTELIQVNVIHKAVGQISESDVVLAAASDAIIIGFQVRPSQAARRQADKEGVEIRLYSVIYNAIEEVKSAMEGMLAPEVKEEVVALVEIREVFKITKVGSVAGCMVKEGKIKRGNKVRLIRDGIVIYTGELGSLKRFKDDVKEVAFGYECGLNISGYNDIQIGDMIEAYEEIEVRKTL
ncbi:MAG: translation initiation factor IF-2 [Tannerellaceae bacterium]|jgi:translation initiation factor IF-2|nr:translation initiation factor IF-2 [Tannerellaceae bacterium]